MELKSVCLYQLSEQMFCTLSYGAYGLCDYKSLPLDRLSLIVFGLESEL